MMPIPVSTHRNPIRNAFSLRKSPLSFFEKIAREGDVLLVPVALEKFVVISDPAIARSVLLKEEHSRQHNLEVPLIQSILGEGALTTDGTAWELARRASGPPLAPRAVEGMREVLDRVVAARLDALPAKGPIFPEMTALTVRVTVEALLGLPMSDSEARKLADEVLFAQAYLFFWLGASLKGVPKLPTSNNRRFYSAVGGLEALVAAVMQEAPRTSFTQHLSRLRTPEGIPLSPQQQRDQLLTMLVAAPENTATSLSWTLHLLSTHPDIQTRLRSEEPGSPYWKAVLKESMRLYPGAPYLDRRVQTPSHIGDHTVPAGALLLISPYVIQRDPRFWVDPEVFRPERFLEDPDPTAWLAFGAGPRRCVGEHLAMAILQTALPAILHRFEVLPVAGYTAAIDPVINLRPKQGLPLELRVTTLKR